MSRGTRKVYIIEMRVLFILVDLIELASISCISFSIQCLIICLKKYQIPELNIQVILILTDNPIRFELENK
jgi:hypothetical protein